MQATGGEEVIESLPPEVVEGDLVQLYRYSNGALAYQIGLTRLDALDLSRGWVDLTSTTALSGDYNGTTGGWGIFARITDAAGNASPISTTRGNLPWLTVDRTAPVVPNTLALLAQDDTGASSTDTTMVTVTIATTSTTGPRVLKKRPPPRAPRPAPRRRRPRRRQRWHRRQLRRHPPFPHLVGGGPIKAHSCGAFLQFHRAG